MIKITKAQEFRLLRAHFSSHGRGYCETRTGAVLVKKGLAKWVGVEVISLTDLGRVHVINLLANSWADSQFAELANRG